MMTWLALAKALGAEFVGGEMIATVGGKRVSLGKKVQGICMLNDQGKSLAKSLPEVPADITPAHTITPTPTPTRRGRPRKILTKE